MQTKTHKKVEKSGSCPVSGISLQFLIIKVLFNYLPECYYFALICLIIG